MRDFSAEDENKYMEIYLGYVRLVIVGLQRWRNRSIQRFMPLLWRHFRSYE